jgi:hypothetical protein
MAEHPQAARWIERCAIRIEARHMLPAPDARELATEVFKCVGDHACPERAADELLRLHAVSF